MTDPDLSPPPAGRAATIETILRDWLVAHSGSDIIVLAVIEHAHVEVGGLPAQNWALRVTRPSVEWWKGHLAHRHADPLAHPYPGNNRRRSGGAAPVLRQAETTLIRIPRNFYGGIFLSL